MYTFIISYRSMSRYAGVVALSAWAMAAVPVPLLAQELKDEQGDNSAHAADKTDSAEEEKQEQPSTTPQRSENDTSVSSSSDSDEANDGSEVNAANTIASQETEQPGRSETETDSDEWADFEEAEASEQSSSGMESLPFELHGFVESLTASRIVRSDASPDDITAMEGRFRLSLDAQHEFASTRFRGDFVADGTRRSVFLDIRDASVFASAGNWFSVRVGRQVLTWGTGDFIFINDLFPKDFVSFFAGRDQEYLKAPSNALRLTLSASALNFDFVWTPVFEADRFISGERFSFFDPMSGSIIGGNSAAVPIQPTYPNKLLRNGEFSGRVYGNIKRLELAAYGYAGFWKQPNAVDLTQMTPTFARLAVYGASARSPLFGGLVNVEGAYYHSFDDDRGVNPAVPNSQVRALVGYEHEIFSKFQAGAQYYLEHTLNHQDLIANSFWPEYELEQWRQLSTLRLTYLLLRDNLNLSLFTFFSPSDLDTYIRPAVTYKWSDELALSVGANIMFGKHDYTFFGQLEQNTNVYGRVRYTF